MLIPKAVRENLKTFPKSNIRLSEQVSKHRAKQERHYVVIR